MDGSQGIFPHYHTKPSNAPGLLQIIQRAKPRIAPAKGIAAKTDPAKDTPRRASGIQP